MTFIYPDDKPKIEIDPNKEIRCAMCKKWFPWQGNAPEYNRVQCTRCDTVYPYPFREVHHHVGWGEDGDHIQRVEYVADTE